MSFIEFKNICKTVTNPYDRGVTPSREIVKTITEYVYSPHTTAKEFYDL